MLRDSNLPYTTSTPMAPRSRGLLLLILTIGWAWVASPVQAQPMLEFPDQELVGVAGAGLGSVLAGERGLGVLGGPLTATLQAVWDGAGWTFGPLIGSSMVAAAMSGSDAATHFGTSLININSYVASSWFVTSVIPVVSSSQSVALAGDWAAVGLPVGLGGVGTVSIFERTEGSWTLHDTLTSSDPSERFGAALALRSDGLVLAVGAPGDGSGGTGRVERFVRSGSSWVSLGSVSAPSGEADNGFGSALALEGQTLVVGAPGEDRGLPPLLQTDAGAVFVYDTDLALTLVDTLRGELGGDLLGSSVDLRGPALLAGAPGVDVELSPMFTLDDVGAANVYWELAPGTWEHHAVLLPTTFVSQFQTDSGMAVAWAGSAALVGAPGTDGDVADRGAVYSYTGLSLVFANGFESGDTSVWTLTSP